MESLLKRATDSPLGKSALGVVVLLLFGLVIWLQVSNRNELAANRADAQTFRQQFMDLLIKEQDRNDKQRTAQWQALSKLADGLNSVGLATATGFARIEATLRIMPEDRGNMPTPKIAAPKPVELTPPQ
jgi:type VI protein secretion system component VasK